jgi:DNA polymerase-3 subunit beta
MANAKVQKADLLSALALCGSFTSNSKIVPILGDLLVLVEPSGMTVTATDLDVSVTAPVKSTADESFAFTAKAHVLLGWVRLLPECEITISRAGSLFFTEMRHPRGRMKIAGVDPKSFPRPTQAEPETIVLPLKELAAVIKRVEIAVSSRESKHTLPCSLLELSSAGAALVGTDGYRMSVCALPLPGCGEMSPVLLTLHAMKAISKLADASKAELVNFGIGTGDKPLYFFEANGYRVVARGLDGRFSPYKRALPAKHDSEVTANRLELVGMLRRTLSMSDEKSRTVVLGLEPGNLTVTGILTLKAATSTGDDAEDGVVVVYDGPAFEMRFNGTFLLDYLVSSPAESIRICLNSPREAAELRDVGSDDSRYVVMPMRV